MEGKKTKKVLVDLGNVRIREFDSLNVQIERAEGYYDEEAQKVVVKWRFKGYANNIRSALKAIVNKELLIDKDTLRGLDRYIEQIEQANAKVLAAVNEMSEGGYLKGERK